MGNLSDVINRVSLSVGVFHTGQLCGQAVFEDPSSQVGHLHLLKSGTLRLIRGGGETELLTEPTLILVPRPMSHCLLAEALDQADLVCASIRYGAGSSNPLANALPAMLILPLTELGRLRFTAEWLFEEATSEGGEREAMMNRLCEILVIQLLRFVTERGLVETGMLAGLAHPQLAKCLIAMHARPSEDWPLEVLAEMAGMSRTKFAMTFREVVGKPPGDYLIEWRLGVAQELLKKGRPVNLVANEVGYENASALARVFHRKLGLSPREWLRTMKAAWVRAGSGK